jgi:phage terminase Nu1 subunit (DNA packaging protein)
MKNAATRGDMVKALDVEREWSGILRDVRSTLLAVPSRVGAKLPHLSARDVAEIDQEVKAALGALSDGN